jgi:hypothetical protein
LSCPRGPYDGFVVSGRVGFRDAGAGRNIGVTQGGEGRGRSRGSRLPERPQLVLDVPPPELCYAPGTSPEVIRRNARQIARGSSLQANPFQFSDGSRWSATATDGGGLALGQVTTITWNIVPDGTPMAALGGIAGESSAASNLKAFLNGIYAGGEAEWLAHFQTVFDRWGAITGVNYVKVNYDDGAGLATANGVLGVRADVRIGGHPLDGNSNVLAYNFFPSNGDMFIDTSDNYYSGAGKLNNSLGFRNMLAHEHGHGLGFNHSCPTNQTKLMEPSVSTQFTHAQQDDILAGWRGYGDDKEDNETSGTASNLGTLANGVTTITELSADDNSDIDFYKFTVPAGKWAGVTMTPTGTTLPGGSAKRGWFLQRGHQLQCPHHQRPGCRSAGNRWNHGSGHRQFRRRRGGRHHRAYLARRRRHLLRPRVRGRREQRAGVSTRGHHQR